MIYVFGGAFDPPHAGHAAIIRAILYKKNPEKIIILPKNNFEKFTKNEHTMVMLDIFVRDIRDKRVVVDDFFLNQDIVEPHIDEITDYIHKNYSDGVTFVFGFEKIFSLLDEESLSFQKIKKLFVPQKIERIFFSQGYDQDGKMQGQKNKIPPKLGGQRGCVNFLSPKSEEFLKKFAKDLRKNQTLPESMLWNEVFSRKQFGGHKILRQHTLGNFIVDFYLHKYKIIFEVDGDFHSEQQEKDQKRDEILQKSGYCVVRIPAFEILYNFEGVKNFLEGILEEIEQKQHTPQPPNLGGTIIHAPQSHNLGGAIIHTPQSHNLEETTTEIQKKGKFNDTNKFPNLGGATTSFQESKILEEKAFFDFDKKIFEKIKNFEIFSDSHFPDISSTQIRESIPDYTHVSVLYDDHLKTFKIPGLSNKISLYILENRLYRHHLPKEKLLVHVCCGPDVVMPILQLRDEYDLICFWYDPNIQPKSEYDKRYEAFVKVCEIEKIPFIKGVYDVKNFFSRIKGYEFTPEKTGEKCTRCYDMRMYVAAKLAKKLKIPNYTTSLNTSPKKDLDKMFFMGHKYADQFGIKFLDIPFRKRGGFALSAEYTKEHNIYRQNYCGCIYSIREGGDSDMKRKMVG